MIFSCLKKLPIMNHRFVRQSNALSWTLFNNHKRALVTSSSSPSASRRITEVNIPTPWGHLATKCWNLPSLKNPADLSASEQLPVVCLHAWQDNAGTYDTLIPLLDQDIPFICLDFSGHGLSSHVPLGTEPYVGCPFDVMRVVHHFGLSDSKFNLMGHSMGGAFGICLAGTYPQMVRKLLVFDPLYYLRKYEDTPRGLADGIKNHLELEKKGKRSRKYSFDEASVRFAEARRHTMNVDSSKILLRRGLKMVEKNESGESLYEFSLDRKLNIFPVYPFGPDNIRAFVDNVSCDLRQYVFKNKHWEMQHADDELFANFGEFEEFENCRSFELIEMEGLHHAHLDRPEIFAAEVNSFFKGE